MLLYGVSSGFVQNFDQRHIALDIRRSKGFEFDFGVLEVAFDYFGLFRQSYTGHHQVRFAGKSRQHPACITCRCRFADQAVLEYYRSIRAQNQSFGVLRGNCRGFGDGIVDDDLVQIASGGFFDYIGGSDFKIEAESFQ